MTPWQLHFVLEEPQKVWNWVASYVKNAEAFQEQNKYFDQHFGTEMEQQSFSTSQLILDIVESNLVGD